MVVKELIIHPMVVNVTISVRVDNTGGEDIKEKGKGKVWGEHNCMSISMERCHLGHHI